MFTEAIRLLKSKLRLKLNPSDKRAKIQDCDFILGLLQAVASSRENFSLSQLRLSVGKFVGTTIGASAFNERMGTSSLANNLKLVLKELILYTGSRSNTSPAAAQLANKLGVSEVCAVDGSMVTLWDGLRDHFKGTFMESAVKLHMMINLVSSNLLWLDITPGATHDSQRFPMIKKGALYIYDLGYWSAPLIGQINKAKAFFLSRVKQNAHLMVTKVVDGIGQGIVGRDLLSFPIHNKRSGSNIIELIATLTINQKQEPFRVLGFWDKKSRIYRWYITNLNSPRHLIYDLYRLRWQIEISFKAMKSTLNFDRMPTLNANGVESFTLIALINYLLAVILKKEAERQALKTGYPHGKSISIQRAAMVFSVGAGDILQWIKLGKRLTVLRIRRVLEMILPLLTTLFDPNYKQRQNSANQLLEA